MAAAAAVQLEGSHVDRQQPTYERPESRYFVAAYRQVEVIRHERIREQHHLLGLGQRRETSLEVLAVSIRAEDLPPLHPKADHEVKALHIHARATRYSDLLAARS